MSRRTDGHHAALRREASPLGYNRLDVSQQEGFGRITEALQDAVGSLDNKEREPKQSPNPWNPWIPKKDRKSNVLFLSGERGTGKTTLMLSVLETFLDPQGLKIASADGLQHRVDKLSKRILWLAPIDMEPLPQPSNLFAAILARIEHALDHQIGHAEDESSDLSNSDRFPGILDNPRGQGPYRECLKRLRMLQRNVSTAWNGNLGQRASMLDTDEYFHEVVRSERARVNLSDELDDLLDRLAGEAPWLGGLKNPLFVLPIDDIDLNPVHAVDLLNLLRTISSKRLFTLILGDIALMERVLEYKIAGTLSELRRGIRVHDDKLIDEAREAAGDGLRKLIPPGQRIHLSNISAAKALDFKPVDEDETLNTYLEEDLLCLHPVGALAREVKPVRAPAEASYKDLALPLVELLADSIVQGSVPLESRLQTRFLGLRLLSATPRFLSDLTLSLQEILKRKREILEQQPVSESDAGQDQNALKGWLEQSHRDIVALVAHRFLETAPSERERSAVWQHEPGRWCLDRSSFHWRMTKTEHRSIRLDDFRLEVPRLNEAQVFVTASEKNVPEIKRDRGLASKEASAIKLSGDCAASLSLLHDLLALQLTQDEETLSSVVGDPLFEHAERVWATVQWNTSGMEVNWRLPDWLSVGEYSLFVDYWMKAHAGIIDSISDNQHAYFLFAWIAGATNVQAIPLFDPDTDRKGLVALPSYQRRKTAELPWNELLALLQTVFSRAKQHENNWALSEFVRIARDWAVDLAMILAPEAGTPEAIANKFFTHKDLTDVWLTDECCATVRRLRAEQCLDLGCVPHMLGLISPDVAFDTIGQLTGPSNTIDDLVKQARAKLDKDASSTEYLKLALDEQLSEEKNSTANIRLAAEYAAGLQLAARHNPGYNSLDAAKTHGGLSPTETDLRRYADWSPKPSSD